MPNTPDANQSSSPDILEDALPEWYREIFPAGVHNGFYEKLGMHALIHVARDSDTLVVTFDNLSDAGYPGYDIKSWAEKFIRDNGWSHLGVVAQGATWFRDADLIDRMEELAAQDFFAKFKRVVMAGTSMGGFGALAFADLVPGCDVLAFSPQTSLSPKIVPWEPRFGKGKKYDWSLPRSDVTKTLSGVSNIWVVYDPFLRLDKRHVMRLPQDKVIHLKAFGQGHKTAMVMRRMDLLKQIMTQAVAGTLTQKWFQGVTRARKDIYIYRKSMEDHLIQRGKEWRVPQLTRAFRAHRRRQEEITPANTGGSNQGNDTKDPHRTMPASTFHNVNAVGLMIETSSRQAKTLGNVWHLTEKDGVLLYLSDQYGQKVMGFEERFGQTLAQSPQVALGIVCVGAATAIPRPLPERFDYHIRDEVISQDTAPLAAEAHGVASLRNAQGRSHAMRSIIAISQPQPGIVAAESHPSSQLFLNLNDRVSEAAESLANWDRILFVDRIVLDLLSGSPDLSETDASAHYINAIKALRLDIAQAAGQNSLPHTVISQKAGHRTDGRSEVILAEGRLDVHEPGLGIVIASPTYMLQIMPETVSTLVPEDRLWVDELENLAIEAVQNGKKWFCPALRQVVLRGTELIVEFSCMGPLMLDHENHGDHHGFALDGCSNDARITGIRLEPPQSGSQCVVLTLDREPEGDALAVRYAWGETDDRNETNAHANQGSLREEWSQKSVLQDERLLYRYALSGRLQVMASHLEFTS